MKRRSMMMRKIKIKIYLSMILIQMKIPTMKNMKVKIIIFKKILIFLNTQINFAI
jgi:hypothetical protein